MLRLLVIVALAAFGIAFAASGNADAEVGTVYWHDHVDGINSWRHGLFGALVVEPRGTDMHITYRAGLRHPLDIAASGVAILAGSPPLPGEREAIKIARQRS